MREDSNAHAVANIEFAARLEVPHLDISRPRRGQFVIVGGAPSSAFYEDDIRCLKFQHRNCIVGLNWMHNWLIKRGVVPDACVLFEIDVEPTGVLDSPHPDVTYYVCSHCHKRTHKALRGFKTVLWHAMTDQPEITAAQSRCFPGEPLLSGGSTTLIRAIDVGRVLGFRNFELFGCDSSFDGPHSMTHVNGYPLEVHKVAGQLLPGRIKMGESGFWTMPYLLNQAEQFKQWCQANHSTFLMQVHGDNLLRHLHEQAYPEMYL